MKRNRKEKDRFTGAMFRSMLGPAVLSSLGLAFGDAADAVVYDTTGDGATAVTNGDTIAVVRSAWNDKETTAYIIYITAHQGAENDG